MREVEQIQRNISEIEASIHSIQKDIDEIEIRTAKENKNGIEEKEILNRLVYEKRMLLERLDELLRIKNHFERDKQERLFEMIDRIRRMETSMPGLRYFFFQFLAWIKLSEENKIKKEDSFFSFKLQDLTAKKLKEIFENLHNSYTKNKYAFKLSDELFDLSWDVLIGEIGYWFGYFEQGIIRKEDFNWSLIDEFVEKDDFRAKELNIGKEIILLMEGILKHNEGFNFSKSFGLPFYSGAFLKALSENNYHPFLENRYSPYVEIFNILNDVKLRTPQLEDWQDQMGIFKFDFTLCKIPNSNDFDYFKLAPEGFEKEERVFAEEVYLKNVLDRTKNLAVIGIGSNFLTKRISRYSQLKKTLILGYNYIDAVIKLPKWLFKLGAEEFSIIVFDKEKKDKNIFFINASSDNFDSGASFSGQKKLNYKKIFDIYSKREEGPFSSIIPVSDILERKDWNIDPSKLVLNEEGKKLGKILTEYRRKEKLVPLIEIAQIMPIHSLMFKSYSKDMERERNEFEECLEVTIDSIPKSGFIHESFLTPIKIEKDKIKKNQEEERRSALLRPFDILLGIKGSIGKVGIVPEKRDELPWIPGQSFVVIRVRREPSRREKAICILMFLKSNLGQEMLKSLNSASAIPNIPVSDLRDLEIIWNPNDLEEQEEIVNAFGEEEEINQKIKKMEEDLRLLKNKFWPLEQV